jgi:hypothetical protein
MLVATSVMCDAIVKAKRNLSRPVIEPNSGMLVTYHIRPVMTPECALPN